MRRRAALLPVLLLGACTTSHSPTPAPNLASPAPEAAATTRAVGGQCFLLPVRAQQIQPSQLVDVLGEQVPTRMLGGFGLLVGWTSVGAEGGSNGAIWTDASCRQVTLEIWPDGAARESLMPDGHWLLVQHDICTRHVLCLDYHAHSGNAAVDLSFVGLSQQDASSIVTGVHV